MSTDNEEFPDIRPGASKSSGGTLGKAVAIIGAAIVLVAVADLLKGSMPTRGPGINLLDAEISSSGPNKVIQFGGINTNRVLENPEISWFESVFCVGYRKATFCSNKPMHPLVSYIEETFGVDYQKWAAEKGRPLEPTRIPGKTSEKADLRYEIHRD